MIIENKILYNLKNFIEQKPITADLFLTNFCNNKCSYCVYKRWDLKTKEKRYLKFEDFKRNINILLKWGVKGFILTGGGEPCINPDFDKITKYLEQNNLNYGINTNFNILKFIKPVYLKISLDAFNEESYFNIRGVNNYNKVIENIKKYIEWKEKNNVKTNIVIQCVVDNIECINNFYNSIKDLKVNFIVFRPIESTNGEFYKNKDNEENAIKCYNELLKLKNTDNRICINYKWDQRHCKFNKCIGNFLQIAIDENSNLIYCCHKPYEIIGHITDNNILEKRKKFITDINKCDIPCRLTGPNIFVEKIYNYPIDKDFI